jgi:hypothetical protein
MALLTVQRTSLAGLSPTWAVSAPTGDSYPNTGTQTLQVRNQGATPITVSVPAQNACNQGTLHPLSYSVPAAGLSPMLLGPFTIQFYSDPSGNLNFTYSTTVQPAPGAPNAALVVGTSLGIGAYRYAVTFVNATGETTGGAEISITTTSGNQAVKLDGIPLGPGGTTQRRLWRTSVGGATATEKLFATIADNTTQTYTDAVPDTALGAAIPVTNTAAVPAPGAATVAAGAAGTPNGAYRCQVTFVNAAGETTGGAEFTITVASLQINWSAIPLGPTGTTQRKLYRTSAAGASGTEKLVTTIADNTTTTFTDNVADGALGAAIPTTNTANVVQVAVIAA